MSVSGKKISWKKYRKKYSIYIGIFAQIEKFVSLGLNFQQVCIVMKRFRSMYDVLVGRAQLTVVHDDNCKVV